MSSWTWASSSRFFSRIFSARCLTLSPLPSFFASSVPAQSVVNFFRSTLEPGATLNSLTNFCLIMAVDVLLLRDERHRRWVEHLISLKSRSLLANDGVPCTAAPTRAHLLRDYCPSVVRSMP